MAGTLAEKFADIDKQNGWLCLYTNLRQQSSCSIPSCDEAKITNNVRLNRYRDVLPFDHSRVQLGNGGYINASFVPIGQADRKYVLTQGPLPHTAGHFWQMVWEQRSSAIVMLNQITEKGQNKCYPYYPSEDDNGCSSKVRKHGDYEITLTEERKTKHYVVRSMELKLLTSGEVRKVTQFQFINWPDFGVPESTTDFLEFLLEVRRSGLLNYRKFGPPVIHCSAGIGRSGTFIIADGALVIAYNTKSSSQIDICQMVLELRQHRMGLIQTHEQLRFSWKAVVDALEHERWKELLETTCCDADALAALDLEDSSNRPQLKRMVGNQFTDDSSTSNDGEAEEDDEDEDESRTASSSSSKEPVNSPKRLKPDGSRLTAYFSDDANNISTRTECKADSDLEVLPSVRNLDDEQLEAIGDHVRPAISSTESVGASVVEATESYETRVHRRKLQAQAMRERLDKMHDKLHSAESERHWKRTNLLYGGAFVVVGGFLVYLFSRWF